MHIVLAAILAVATASSTTAGQDRPNFSGVWERVTPASDSRQIIEQDATTLTFYYESDGAGTAVTYKLDGTETTRTTRIHESNLVTLVRAEWTGGTVKITETHAFPGAPKTQDTQLWWLDAQGRLIVEFTSATEGQKPTGGIRVSRRVQ